MKEQKRIQKAIDHWRPLMGLADWQLGYTYHEGEYISFDGTPSEKAIATTSVQWQYQRASLAFNTEETAKLNQEELEAVVVHELSHVLVNEMREGDAGHEERVTTMVTAAILRAAGWSMSPVRPARAAGGGG